MLLKLGENVRLIIEDDGTFREYVHGGQVNDGSFYRVWIRDQEYSEELLPDSSREMMVAIKQDFVLIKN